MGYGLKLKRPFHLHSTDINRIDNIPEVMLRLDAHHKAVVNKGERVLSGQLIATSELTPLYSSVSGNVVGIDSIDGTDYIKIKNDNNYKASPTPLFEKRKLSDMTNDEILERIRLCAIPEWKLLSNEKGFKRLVVNCLDADNCSFDKKVAIQKHARELIGGAKILLKLLGLSLCEIVIEKRNTGEINDLLEFIGESPLFDIIETSGKYPFGEDSRIISQLPSPEKATEDETCVINSHAVAAIYRAFSEGYPWVSRYVSVSGSAVTRVGCYEIPLGTPIGYVSQSATEKNEGNARQFIFSENGVMNGNVKAPDKCFVTESTHSLIFTDESDTYVYTSACIGCARCDKVCPEGLSPSAFIKSYANDPNRALNISGLDKCAKCGACSYVCPAKLPIQEIAQGNHDIGNTRNLHKKQQITKAPIIRSADSVKTMNLDLIFALCVLLGWAVCRFGIMSLVICAATLLCAVGSDILYSLITKGSIRSVRDLSSVVCGLLCGLTLSIETPIYVCAISAFFAVMIVRGAFGGNSRNIIHSAFAARVLVSLVWHEPFVYDSGRNYTLFDHLLGNTDGALGEVSFIILGACALYLMYRRVIAIAPMLTTLLSFVVTMFICAPASNAIDYVKITLISSAVLLVSIFSSSEYSTLPSTLLGRIAYGVICGSVAAVITRFTQYEGAYIAAITASLITVPIFSLLGKAKYSEAKMSLVAENNETTEKDLPAEKVTELSDADESVSIADEATTDESNFNAEEETNNSADNFDIDSSKLLDALSVEIGLSDDGSESDSPLKISDTPEINSDELFRQLYNETE